jgi:hypothetical protein
MSVTWSVEQVRLQAVMTRAVREHWALFLIEGASFGIARRDSIAARGVVAAAGWPDWRP